MTKAYRALFLVVGITGAALAFLSISGWWRAGALLVAISGRHGGTATTTTTTTTTMTAASARADLIVEDITVPTAVGPVRGRIYRPLEGAPGRGVVVVHGVHHQGLDERRMIPFAEELARAGLTVLTPEVADLADYRITPAGVSVIRDAALHLASRSDEVMDKRVGIIGFSFAGGLALVAAADPLLRSRLAFVTSVGGHHDLARVLRFLIRDEIESPTGRERRKAHDYGLIVLLYGSLPGFVAAEDLPAMREALRAWLRQDRAGARAAVARLATPGARALWARVEGQRLQELADAFEKVVADRRDELAALSPRGRLATIGAPVYLLHGSGDSVIPASETEWAAVELGTAPHDKLVSPLLEHVEVSHSAALSEKLALVRFIAQML